jgi:hypothetical protein
MGAFADADSSRAQLDDSRTAPGFDQTLTGGDADASEATPIAKGNDSVGGYRRRRLTLPPFGVGKGHMDLLRDRRAWCAALVM